MMEKYGQYVQEMGKDETGLGRWTWIRVKGDNGIATKIIVAYTCFDATKLTQVAACECPTPDCDAFSWLPSPSELIIDSETDAAFYDLQIPVNSCTCADPNC